MKNGTISLSQSQLLLLCMVQFTYTYFDYILVILKVLSAQCFILAPITGLKTSSNACCCVKSFGNTSLVVAWSQRDLTCIHTSSSISVGILAFCSSNPMVIDKSQNLSL